MISIIYMTFDNDESGLAFRTLHLRPCPATDQIHIPHRRNSHAKRWLLQSHYQGHHV